MIILAGITILLLIYIYVHYDEKSRLIYQIFPGPTRIPFIGVLPWNIYPLPTFYTYVFELAKTFNYQPFCLWFLHKPYIVITDSKVAKIVLSKLKYTDKMDLYYALEPWMGRNHFLGSGEQWLKYRKFDSSVLSFQDNNACGHHLQIFYKYCGELCRKLSKHEGKGIFDVHEYIRMYALANIYESVTGLEMTDETSFKPCEEAYIFMENLLFLRAFVPIFRVDWIYNLSSWGRRQKKYIQILSDLSQDVIQKQKESLFQGQQNGHSDKNKVMAEDDYLIRKHLVQSQFTEKEIQIEIESAIFAGHDTMSTALCFLLHALAEFPQSQEKICSELKSIFDETDTCPDINQLNSMKYTEQFILETMRYYPVVFNTGRYVKEDVYINEKQYIPKNTNVIISMGAIHKNPVNWPNPDVFDPDRFSEEMVQKRDPYAFIAFGAGPRNCMGTKYSMLEMKMTIAQVLKRFKLSLSDNPEDHMKPALNFVTQSANGYHIKIQSRKMIE